MLPWLSSIPKVRMALLVLPPNFVSLIHELISAFLLMVNYFLAYFFHICFFSSARFSSQLIIERSIIFDVCSFCYYFFLHFIDHCFSYPWFSGAISIMPISLFRIFCRASLFHLSPSIFYAACYSIYLTEFLPHHFFHMIFFALYSFQIPFWIFLFTYCLYF